MLKPDEVIQAVLQLDPGDMVVVPCIGYNHMESLRIALYRAKAKLKNISSELSDEVIITRSTKNDRYSIILSRCPILETAYILRKTGKVENLSDYDPENELFRIQKMMRADGKSEKEIDKFTEEFKQMVKSIREVEKALGKVTCELTKKAKKSKIFARSLFVVKDIKKGELFTEKNIRSIRPGYGEHPKLLQKIIGKKAACDIKKGTPFNKLKFFQN